MFVFFFYNFSLLWSMDIGCLMYNIFRVIKGFDSFVIKFKSIISLNNFDNDIELCFGISNERFKNSEGIRFMREKVNLSSLWEIIYYSYEIFMISIGGVFVRILNISM